MQIVKLFAYENYFKFYSALHLEYLLAFMIQRDDNFETKVRKTYWILTGGGLGFWPVDLYAGLSFVICPSVLRNKTDCPMKIHLTIPVIKFTA